MFCFAPHNSNVSGVIVYDHIRDGERVSAANGSYVSHKHIAMREVFEACEIKGHMLNVYSVRAVIDFFNINIAIVYVVFPV